MSIRSLFLDALYPRRLTCDLCGRETRLAPSGPGAYFCPDCLSALEPIPETPMAFGYLDGVQAGLFYNDAAARLIHAFKYAGAKYLAESLGAFLPTPPDADWIIPVPLHPFRRRQRGYNQSLLLAQHLSRTTGIPMQTKTLTRIRNTPSQAQRTHAERPGNVRDAFLAGRGLQGSRVLLVDDVVTTGSTLDACAQALRMAGAAGVWAVTVCTAGEDLENQYHIRNS